MNLNSDSSGHIGIDRNTDRNMVTWQIKKPSVLLMAFQGTFEILIRIDHATFAVTGFIHVPIFIKGTSRFSPCPKLKVSF